MIVWAGGILPPRCSSYQDAASLVDAVRAVYAEASEDPVRMAGSKVYVFHGTRLTVTGNPVRVLVTPDGQTHHLAPVQVEPDGADDWLLPKVARGG